jgi:hypothetical protein
MGVFFFFASILFFAPYVVSAQFGFNFYLNGIIINGAELINFIFSISAITKVKRKTLFRVVFLICLGCSVVLLFLVKSTVCTSNCWNAGMILQLGLFFVLCFCLNMQYCVLFVFITELYPIQVANIGIGFSMIVSCLPNIFLSPFINYLNTKRIPVMSIFVVSLICLLLVLPLVRETYGDSPQEMIDEFERPDFFEKR